MKKLTAKQQQIYDFIADRIATVGYPPSVREIGQAVDLKSPSTVHMHLGTLEREGYIVRNKEKSRAIVLANATAKPEGVPVLGTVAAGQPILAVEDAIGFIPYDTGSNGTYFALKIKGESMINAGILDGDMVIVKQQSHADAGDIIIALINDEATCKRLRFKGGHVLLMPENDEYQPIDGDEAKVLGKVTAVIRVY